MVMKKTKEPLSITHPHLLEEWDYEKNIEQDLFPDQVTYGSKRKAWWVCLRGHSYRAALNDRTGKKSGCSYCGGKKLLKENSLEVKYPEILIDWNYNLNIEKPSEIPYGTHKKYCWKCHVCGYEWNSKPLKKIELSCGCPNCIGSKLNNKNNLLAVNPSLASE